MFFAWYFESNSSEKVTGARLPTSHNNYAKAKYQGGYLGLFGYEQEVVSSNPGAQILGRWIFFTLICWKHFCLCDQIGMWWKVLQQTRLQSSTKMATFGLFEKWKILF